MLLFTVIKYVYSKNKAINLIKILIDLFKLGHDCSLRLWDIETKSCIQELTAHRKKYDESIHCIAFHPTKPFIASGGADAIVKIYV